MVYHCGWWQWPPGNFKPNIRTWDWSDLVYKISVIHMSGKQPGWSGCMFTFSSRSEFNLPFSFFDLFCFLVLFQSWRCWTYPANCSTWSHWVAMVASKELEVQRDTNVARLQTTTIYNFFNKHLDRWRIKEYTSSQSMYNAMSLNFLRASNVSCFSTKKHTHQVTFKSPENTIEATRKCCGWWFGNLLGHRDRLSVCWVSFGFRFFSVDHGLGIPGGEWLMGEDGGYHLPWNESKLDELRFLGFLFNLLDECFFVLVSWLFEVSVGTDEASEDFFQKQYIIVKHQFQKKNARTISKTNTSFATCFDFFCEEVAFVSCFYNQKKSAVLQHRSLSAALSLWSVATTWGNEGFMEISTWNRSPGDFFRDRNEEDEGNLTRRHFRIDIDSGWWRAILDSVDISWYGWIPIENIIAKIFVFGPLDHEVLIDAGHILRYSQA